MKELNMNMQLDILRCPTWFCIAMNSLSVFLNRTKYGFLIIPTVRNVCELYIDDLKLLYMGKPKITWIFLKLFGRFSSDI